MLAALPVDRRRDAIAQLAKEKLLRYTERSVVDGKELLRRINVAARLGYAVVDREYLDDLSAVGGAVISAGEPVAGVTLLAPSYRLSTAASRGAGRAVADCAARVTADLLRARE